ncbi:MAG: histidinol dehydrogenase [Lachnospiraceae bacterium]|nr:histidinol dehydrogenase [Lachnospiraceae bacterium]
MNKYLLNDENKQNLLNNLLKRSTSNYPEYEKKVADICDDIKARKDEAVFEYTLKFDKFSLNASNIRVTDEEIDEAYDSLDSDFIDIMKEAFDNIRDYHRKQLRTSFFDTTEDGTFLGQRILPIETVGVYVPGGKAAYPSSTLMNIVPALVAGCKRIVMTTPCNAEGRVNATTLAAAKICGINEIYKVGGAQAIAALAYGTDIIPKVSKIVGPGNIFVALAKRYVYGHVSIDSIAGPSEILVLADETANPKFLAADLMSQCEHDEMASGILITTSETLANDVEKWVETLLKDAPRKEILEKSLENFGFILVAKNMDDAIDAVNDIASEHLEIITKNPIETMGKVKNAGAIFLGEYSSEPLGDYFAGPNHVLPTNGTAKFFSPLSVDDFIKKSSVICYSKEALQKSHKKIEKFAEKEGLFAHAKSISVRFEDSEE